ncbi:MAG TPA: phytase, partial [Steroidobacteraceae bacterium]|nr:phytase [Steroidobacteraceae bacterium]
MRHSSLVTTAIAMGIALALAACGADRQSSATDSAAAKPPAVAARLATETTFRQSANDAAIWVDAQDPAKSIVLVSGGEGGLEIDELSGGRAARFETLEAGFIDLRRDFPGPNGALDLVIASDQRLGALRMYALDAPARKLTELTAAPIDIDDAITGLCTYRSNLTGKLYAFVATDQGQLEQWELFMRDGKGTGQFIRRIPAGKGISHCAVDDASAAVYFSEESVGIWRVAAEPEAESTRSVVDLVEPRGTLHEEVKGLAIYRSGQSSWLVAADAGAGAFNVYTLDGKRAGAFTIGGNKDLEVGDAEGLVVASDAIGKDYPQGALIVADEDAGNYKIVAWNDVA